jgi:hypothetical protein
MLMGLFGACLPNHCINFAESNIKLLV